MFSIIWLVVGVNPTDIFRISTLFQNSKMIWFLSSLDGVPFKSKFHEKYPVSDA